MAMAELQKVLEEEGGLKGRPSLPAVTGSLGIALGVRLCLSNPGIARRMAYELEAIAGVGGSETMEVMLRDIAKILTEPLDKDDE